MALYSAALLKPHLEYQTMDIPESEFGHVAEYMISVDAEPQRCDSHDCKCRDCPRCDLCNCVLPAFGTIAVILVLVLIFSLA